MWSTAWSVISFLVGLLVPILLAKTKPEWIIGPVLRWLEKKFERKQANIISNALGSSLVNLGLYAIAKIPDNPKAQEIVSNMLEEMNELKKALEEGE